jgi:hypothetical protein
VEAVVEATGNSGQSAGSDVVLQHGQTLFLADGFRSAFKEILLAYLNMHFLQGQKQLSGNVLKIKVAAFKVSEEGC